MLSVLKKLDGIDEDATLTPPHRVDIIERLATRAIGPPFVARAVSKFDIPHRVRGETILLGKHENMPASIRRQFLNDRFNPWENFFHCSTSRSAVSPSPRPNATVDILPMPTTNAKRPMENAVNPPFLAPTSTAILGSQPRQANPIMDQ